MLLLLSSLLFPVILSLSPTHTHHGHHRDPSWKGGHRWGLSLTPLPRSLGFTGPKGHPWEHLIPFSSAAPQGAGEQGAGLRHEHLFTSNWARFPPLSPDRPLPCQRTAWDQLSPSLLTRCDRPALCCSPLTTLRTRGVLQPLGGKLNRMCLWSTENSPTTFPAHSKNKTKENLHLNLGQETWE